jgi:hypothetical protein
MPLEQFLALAEDEKWVKRYHVARQHYIWPVDAHLGVTNKRLILYSEGGLSKIYSMDEVRIEKITGVDFSIKPRNMILLIAGLIFAVIGLILAVVGIMDLRNNNALFSIGLMLFIGGMGLLIAGLMRKFRLLVGVTGLYKEAPEFLVGDAKSIMKSGTRFGLAMFMGRPGTDSVRCAQELGAVILDVQKKGTTNVGMSSMGFNPPHQYQAPPPPQDNYQRPF